jgi:hypothetical protein
VGNNARCAIEFAENKKAEALSLKKNKFPQKKQCFFGEIISLGETT